ncbi:family 20 glycosylhydrolase [Echinicola shivajiensis]|uniref:family 20 glycosylhydrolase n=1 Tax=Echinicola shivajiensis TaxID=1035916 RepID=UPI001BFC8F1A|nr:family 20 glycosylhydrolase [Echinicola shivajiensis]
MKKPFTSTLIFLSIFISSLHAQVSAKWELISNSLENEGTHKAQISLKNNGQNSWDEGWKLYFNNVFISVKPEILTPGFQITHLQGDFFVLEGNPITPQVKPDEEISIHYRSNGGYLKNSYAPEALVLHQANSEITEIVDYQISEMSPEEFASVPGNQLPVPTAEKMYKVNQDLKILEKNQIPPFLPSPKSWSYTGEPQVFKNVRLKITGDQDFSNEINFLTKCMNQGNLPENPRNKNLIEIQINKQKGLADEAYGIKIHGHLVEIKETSPAGAFYGVQSFLAMMQPEFWSTGTSEIILPQLEVIDEPAYEYRGFFLDVARNFQPKEEIKKVLDLIALYKINVFHFNLANDEGWRIEIPGLPELVEFSGRRGFSSDQKDFLWPYYGSNADPKQSPNGSGYYSVNDFQEILSYANERHIEVIPELGVPAHSQAAVLAMEKRYEKLKAEGKMKEAEQYRLADPDDESIYLSAQNFKKNNTMCVCLESTYSFYEKLVSSIKKMYDEVGIPLKTWHTGGDEVPNGVWTASPVCDEFLSNNPTIRQDDLNDYFRSRTADILQKYDIEMAGWEEIGQSHKGEEVIPNPKFSNENWRLHAWNAVAGWGGEDMAYKLANAGYPVVICSSANFYFDLAYSWDPDDRGHTWSGVVDMYQSWKTVPGKLYLSHDQTIDGKDWDWKGVQASFTKLSPKGKRNIIGVSGQVWTETIKGADMLEYYTLPKMLGYLERAWVGDPTWSGLSTEHEMRSARKNEWNVFVNLVGQKVLPQLETIYGGFNYRVPKPGYIIKKGQLFANVELPEMKIRYTLDGSTPSFNSPEYLGPINLKPNSRPVLRVFSVGNRTGKAVSVKID